MARRIEQLSLFVLVTVVVIRPLVAETYHSQPHVFSAALEGLRDPSPVRTLAFDILALACMGMLGLLQACRSDHRVRTGLWVGLALVAIAGILSCLGAGHRRPAINATLDWVAMPLLAITLANSLRQDSARRWIIACLVAVFAANAVHSMDQQLMYAATWEHYEGNKEKFWAQQGVDLGSHRVELFERRIQARESSGYFAHPNVAAAAMLLGTFVVLGIMISARKARLAGGAALLVILLAGLATTKSLAAFTAGGCVLGVWALCHFLRPMIDRHRRALFALGWCAVVFAAGAVVTYGIARDRLPGWSLTFRWQYWTASADMAADHFWTGVGRENFGNHYLQYKSIQSPEEVSTPHNVFVQAMCEWGFLGVIGLAAMIFGGSMRLGLNPPPDEGGARGSGRRSMAAGVAVLLCAVVVRAFLLGTDDLSFVYYESVKVAVVMLGAFACAFWAIGDTVDRRRLAQGIAFGLVAFLIQEMVNFSLFVPGTALLCFAAAGVALSFCPSTAPASGWTRWVPASACAALLLGILLFAALPAGRAHLELARAGTVERTLVDGPLSAQPAYRHFRRAASFDAGDAWPTQRLADWLTRLTGTPTLAAQAWPEAAVALDATMARDPYNVAHPRTAAGFYLRRGEALERAEDFRKAVDYARKALALYPKSPRDLRRLGEVCFFAAGHLEGPERTAVLEESRSRFAEALALDDDRISWEKLHRFTLAEREEVLRRIRQVEGALAGVE